MNLVPFRRRSPSVELVRGQNDPVLSFDDLLGLVSQFSFNGVQYTQPGQAQEQIPPVFLGLARAAYKSNGIVFACMAARQGLLAEARFCFRQRRNGRPGNLFTTADLAPLEQPWPGATTGDLISRMELYASLGGNWFGTNRYGGIRSLRPDWMKIVLGSENDATLGWDPDAVPVGYMYEPGGPGSGRSPVFFLPEEIAHYAPYPDPEAQFRGMSWLTPILREVMADKAATDHKLMFFENGATPNLVVKMDVEDLNKWVNAIRQFSADHEGVGNAYKTMYLGAGMDATVVGANLHQMDFKVTQGAGETRIAAAARVPAAIAQISEGLQGSTLNSGNFDSAMRLFADLMARPAWRNMAGSLSTLVPAPVGAELWYDDRDIPALQEDIKKAGERALAQAQTISSYVASGFDAGSAVDAVTSGDLSRLSHTGLVSVQLLPPGSTSSTSPPTESPPGGGNGSGSNGRQMAPFLWTEPRSQDIQLHLHLEPGALPASVVNFHERSLVSEPKIDVTVEPAQPAEVRLEIAEGAIRVDAPPPAEVNVTVEAGEAPKVEFAEGAIRTEVAAPPPAEVNVTVEAPPPADVNVTVDRGGKRRVQLPDGRSATVTDGDARIVEFDDGRQVTITEVDE